MRKKTRGSVRAAASALLACTVLALAACTPPGAPADAQKTPAVATPAAGASASVSIPVHDARGCYTVDRNGRFGVVDGRGQTVLPTEFAEVQILYDDGEPALFFAVDGAAHPGDPSWTHPTGWLYGMDGTRLTQQEYYCAAMLGSGLVGVWDWVGMGVITTDGEQIVPGEYESIALCGGSIVAVRRSYGGSSGNADMYGMDGTLLKTGVVEGYCYTVDTQWGGFIITLDSGTEKYGLVDLELNEIFPRVWESVQPAGSGTFIVCRDGQYGVVDAQGSEVLPFEYNCIYTNLDAFGEGDTVFIAATAEGITIFNTQWEQFFFAAGYAYLWVYDGVIIANDEAGYSYLLGEDGERMTPAALGMNWYDDVQLVMCQQSYDSAPLYYTRSGAQLPLPLCDSSWPVGEDRFIIMKDQPDGSTRYGLCDAKGNIVLPVQYTSLSAGNLDAGGEYHECGQYLVFSEKNEFDTVYSGVMDMDGNVLLPAVFDYVFPEGGLLRVRTGPAYGLVDLSGNWVWQASDYEALMD